MLVFLCCFLRPARRFYPLRLQIYQKIPGFETKPQSFFSKPSLALHTGVGLTAPARKLLAPQSGLRLSHATRCAFAHSTPGRSRRTDAAMDKKCPCIVARMDFLCYIWTTIRCKGGLLLCFSRKLLLSNVEAKAHGRSHGSSGSRSAARGKSIVHGLHVTGVGLLCFVYRHGL